MKVITSNPILYKDSYLNAEGDPKMLASMNKRQVQAFQDWMNIKYPTWYIPTKGTLPKDSSKYGDKTDSWTVTAWKVYGDDWYKAAMGITKAIDESINPFSIKNLFGGFKPTSKPPTSKPPTQTQQEVIPEETKKMSTTTKVLIGVGGAVFLGTIIYLIVRKK